MKPIIFVRIADMNFYNGITETDKPVNGGSYVQEHEYAHECFNFSPAVDQFGTEICMGFAQLMGGSREKDAELHIENIVGCDLLKKADKVEDITVIWCSKARGNKSMRVVGFYKHATVYRNYQYADFDEDYTQTFSFLAESKNCTLLPRTERNSNSNWYVPSSQQNRSSFGFGRSSIWYAGNKTTDQKEIEYVERMLQSVDTYSGENWMRKEVENV